MAKQVTEEDLASGLSGFGDGFSTITEKRPRRDSPFRDTRGEEPPRAREEKVVDIRPPAEPVAAPRPEHSVTEELLARARAFQSRGNTETVTEVEESVHVAAPTRVPTIEESARHVRISYPDPADHVEKTPSIRKADIFTERVTLQISHEMRDGVEALARELQRRRTKKDERITANTVMRVAINLLLNELELDNADVANSEAELLELATAKLGTGLKG